MELAPEREGLLPAGGHYRQDAKQRKSGFRWSQGRLRELAQPQYPRFGRCRNCGECCRRGLAKRRSASPPVHPCFRVSSLFPATCKPPGNPLTCTLGVEPMKLRDRIVITGVGLTCPIGNSLPEFRANLLEGRSGVSTFETRYMGGVLAGVCHYDELRYQKKKEVRRGTRAGSISIFCAHEAVRDSGLDWSKVNRDRTGVYIGITEHGNVETENEI